MNILKRVGSFVALIATASAGFVNYALFRCKRFILPPQNGKTIVVTGGNSGLGYQSALSWAGAGANVILASRSVDKGETAKKNIISKFPNANVEVGQLDLASFESVKRFASFVKSKITRKGGGGVIDILMNNAGVMALPSRYGGDNYLYDNDMHVI